MKVKNYTDQNLESILAQIIPEFNPKKIILFGSRANGLHSKKSDYDLFFIIPDSDLSKTELAQKAQKLTWRLGHSVDYFFYTESEFNEWKLEINSIAYTAQNEGLELEFV